MTAEAFSMIAENRDFVKVARTWIGTPYRHQTSTKGQGCDCLGLVRGVWRETLGAEPAEIEPYTPDWSEASNDERLWRAALRYLEPLSKDALVSGCILLFRMRRNAVAKHLGIYSVGSFNKPSFIHAYSGHGVVETPLSDPWRRKIVAQFAFPIRRH